MSRPGDESASKGRNSIREAYERGNTYTPDRICLAPGALTGSFVDQLLEERLRMVTKYCRHGRLVDLCCATAAHLFTVLERCDVTEAVGIDFSVRYLEKARADLPDLLGDRVRFLGGDATSLPLATGSVEFLYCFSSLYAIPEVERVYKEVGRVLASGGRCLLDLGNRVSINAYCVRTGYTELPPMFPISVGEMERYAHEAGLVSVEHRAFQILPLWAGKPRWLAPLLHPAWERFMRRRVGGKMIDEWISSLPVLRRFAFRHLVVYEKATETGSSAAVVTGESGSGT